MRGRVWAALLALRLATGTVQAQSAPPHDQVFDLATIRAVHEVCGFALSDEQIEIIDGHEQALSDRDGIASAEFAAVTAEVTASMRRQVGEGVCKPNGAEAQLYQHKLAEYGLL